MLIQLQILITTRIQVIIIIDTKVTHNIQISDKKIVLDMSILFLKNVTFEVHCHLLPSSQSTPGTLRFCSKYFKNKYVS